MVSNNCTTKLMYRPYTSNDTLHAQYQDHILPFGNDTSGTRRARTEQRLLYQRLDDTFTGNAASYQVVQQC